MMPCHAVVDYISVAFATAIVPCSRCRRPSAISMASSMLSALTIQKLDADSAALDLLKIFGQSQILS